MAGKKGKPSRAAAMKAKCHDCMGAYQEGKEDCGVTKCSLYPWMPYRKLSPDLGWQDINPSRKGVVAKGDGGRTMSEEQRKAASERMKKRFSTR